MANVFNTGLENLVDGGIDWGTSDMRQLVVDSGYTFNADHDFVSDLTPGTNEITNTNYARQTLAGEAVIVDDTNDEVQLDHNDWTVTAMGAGDLPDALVTYLFNASDAAAQLLCYSPLTSPPAPNGGDYTFSINAEGIMEISN